MGTEAEAIQSSPRFFLVSMMGEHVGNRRFLDRDSLYLVE
jgi:hypothetical protein